MLLPIQTIMYKQTYHKTFASTTHEGIYIYFKKTKHACFYHALQMWGEGVYKKRIPLFTHYSLLLIPLGLLQDTMHNIRYIDISFTNNHLAFCTGADVHVICSLHIKMEHQRTPNSDQA